MSRKPVLHNSNQESNKILRVRSSEVPLEEIQTPEMQRLVDDMVETMHLETGVGLAAPQIGKNIRLIICETNRGPRAFFNPKIVKTSTRTVDSEEGCLSVPNVYGVVERHKSVKVEALDRDGNTVTIKTGGLLAIIFQHEIDHLDGILFIDKAHSLHDLTAEKAKSII